MEIRFTRNAYADVDAIYDYIAADNPAMAQKVLNKIENMIDYLADHPQLGRIGKVIGTRELIVPDTPYIIAYKIDQQVIDILAIIHSKTRWPEQFD